MCLELGAPVILGALHELLPFIVMMARVVFAVDLGEVEHHVRHLVRICEAICLKELEIESRVVAHDRVRRVEHALQHGPCVLDGRLVEHVYGGDPIDGLGQRS